MHITGSITTVPFLLQTTIISKLYLFIISALNLLNHNEMYRHGPWINTEK